jgi:hypothetical protein
VDRRQWLFWFGVDSRLTIHGCVDATLAISAGFLLVERGEQRLAERLADVVEAIHIARAEDEAAAELERIFAQAVLAHADGFGPFAGARVVRPQQVKQVGFLETEFAISDALVVNQKREIDVVFLAKKTSVIEVAQADGGKSGAALKELLKVLAQLRDVLAAENSTIVPQKDDHRRRISPQGAECYWLAVHVRQGDAGQSGAVSFSHGGTLSCSRQLVSRM